MDLPIWVEPTARYLFEVGLPATLRMAGVAVVASAVVGVVLGTVLTIDFPLSRWLIRLYIEVWRGLPIIVTVFVVFFVFPVLGGFFEFDEFTAVTVGLTLWGSAQVAEATRGAVQSIPKEQHEAAAALGFGWAGRHAFVILPQAFRRLLPPLVSLLVGIIQNTTLGQVIGATELLDAGKQQYERITTPPPVGLGEIHAVEIYGAIAVVFFLISFPLTRLAAWLERRLV